VHRWRCDRGRGVFRPLAVAPPRWGVGIGPSGLRRWKQVRSVRVRCVGGPAQPWCVAREVLRYASGDCTWRRRSPDWGDARLSEGVGTDQDPASPRRGVPLTSNGSRATRRLRNGAGPPRHGPARASARPRRSGPEEQRSAGPQRDELVAMISPIAVMPRTPRPFDPSAGFGVPAVGEIHARPLVPDAVAMLSCAIGWSRDSGLARRQ